MTKVPAKVLDKLLNLASQGGRVRKRQRRMRRNRRPRQNRQNLPTHIVPSKAGGLGLSQTQISHASLLCNPHTGDLSRVAGVYSGEQGHITRFINDMTFANTTNTAGVYIYHPNSGYGFIAGSLTSAVALTITPVANTGGTPGFTFLNTNAEKVRGVAAGFKFSPIGVSLNNITGDVCFGVVSASSLFGSTTFTVDNLFQFAGSRGNITRQAVSGSWYPGLMDDKYSSWNTTAIANTGSDVSDTHCIYVAFRGTPANTTYAVTLAAVTEWVPRPALGLMPTGTVSSGTDHLHTVATLKAHEPEFWHDLKSVGSQVAGDAIRELGVAAKKFVPSMLQGGLAAFGL